MADLATAYVQIVPSARGMKENLSGIFENEMPSAGKSAGGIFGSNLVSTIKKALVAAGIGEALKKSLLEGADLQQSLGGVETLFKDSADTVIKNAEQSYKTAGMSANQYMESVTSFSASLLQGLGGDTEKAAEIADMAMIDMSDNANKMGTSMEAIQNAYQGFAKQNYTMLDNLKLGYGGTKTEMERLLADAKKLSGVEYDISNLSDVYEAIHVIQEEMGITGTTALESSATFSGSLASMKAAASNLLANLSLGRDIGPSLQALEETVFTFITGNLLPMVGNVFSSLPEVIEGALSMAIRGLNLVANNAETIVQIGIELVTGIGTAIISAVPYLAEAALNIVTSLGSALLNADWAGIGNATITALRETLDLAAGEILGADGNIVQSVLKAITTNLPNLLTGGVNMVVSMANGLLQHLPFLLETGGQLMRQLLDTILDALPEILSAGVTLIGELATGLMNNLPAVISSASSILAELVAEIVSHLPELLEQGTALITSLISGAVACIPAIIAAAFDLITAFVEEFRGWDWVEIGDNIINGIYNGIVSGVGAIISAAKQAAQAALNAAKRALGIASPSKVMRDQVGKFIPEGMAVGIEANTKPLKDAMHDLSELTTNSLQADLSMPSVAPVAAANTYRSNSFTFNVYAAQGQDEDTLVEKLMQRIQFEVTRKEAVFG